MSEAVGPSEPPKGRRRDLIWFAMGLALPVPWVVATALGGLGIPPVYVSLLSGAAILGAAFMLSWSCEVGERYIPQAFALLVLALVGVLPEYAVDISFAWKAGQDPTWAPYATANMTGANRLLIGVGWAAVVFVACWKGRTDRLHLVPGQRLELRFLIWATLYSFLIPLNGMIDVFDAAVLLALFAAYVICAMRSDTHQEEELMGPAFLIDVHFTDTGRRLWALGLFVFAGYAIWVSAEPFAHSLVQVGTTYDIDEFVLVQWVAPLASESPEFVVAILFALRLRGSVGIGALVSSKVNQWTLLVGALPIAFMISAGSWSGLPLDDRQANELYLTSAQSLLAAILLADLEFSRKEAVAIFVLFALQLVMTSAHVWFIWLYLGIAAFILIFGPRVKSAEFLALTFSLPSSGRR
ncbi:MAG: sodium:calcium antiporter [Myxococcota bacterium]|nr:sodium:calcium antiporter [Myxococcota bacterium]